jgi:hypothetical protein
MGQGSLVFITKEQPTGITAIPYQHNSHITLDRSTTKHNFNPSARQCKYAKDSPNGNHFSTYPEPQPQNTHQSTIESSLTRILPHQAETDASSISAFVLC